MAELPSAEFIPERALPRFGRGAFRGSVAPHSTPTGDARFGDPAPFVRPHPFVVAPVNPTSFSAGNKVRLGVVGMMMEWWRFRRPMSGEYFVANGEQYTRHVARRMARVRRLDRTVASRRVTYEAPSYGPQAGPDSGAAATSGLPNFGRRRR